MKKYWKLLLCAAMGIGTFTACEDVPAPYNIPTENQTPVVTPVEPTGTGTLEDPFNAAAANAAAKELAADAESEQDYYIKGVVASVKESYSTSFGNASFYISDDGGTSNQFYVYRALYLGNQKYTSGDNIEVGDTVIVCGKITNFRGNTPETVQNKAYLYSLKKGNGTPTTPVEGLVGSGTKEDPYDVPSTIKLIAAGPPSTKIYTKGIVSQVDEISEQYGNATYYISNDGTTTDQLEVYRGLGLGGEKFKANGIKVGDEVIVYGQVVYFNNKTMEFTQGSELYSLNGKTASGGGGESGEAKGSGTLEDPFNGAAANAAASALAADAKSDKAYYIKGKVVSVKESFTAQYGNASFYISDDGTTTGQFYVYRVLYLGNKKWADGDTQIKEGDEVIVCAKLTNFRGNTPETVQGEGYLYSLNGKTEGGTTPTPDPTPGEAKGSGTLADPYNSVYANNIASALASNEKTSEAYYIKGKVVSVKESFGTQYGNASFYISDDGTTAGQFYVFRALYLGNKKWVSGNTQIKVGDEVIVYAKLTNYQGNTPETVQGECYLYSLNGKTEDDGSGSGNDDPNTGDSGNSITFSEKGYSNAQDFDGQTITLGDATLSFSKGTGSTTPKYYNTGTAMRLYGGNSLTISSSKTITKVEFKYGEDYNGTSYYPTAEDSEITPSGYDYTTHVWTGSSKEIVLKRTANTGHFRIISITITYAQ